jgi:hypothetical protein
MKATEFVTEAEKSCPLATQDIALNLKNRQKAIDEYGYGPLNPDLPNDKFWQTKVDEWNLDSVDEAKSSLCGNCAAFDQRQATLACIAQGIGSDAGAEDPTIEAGDLGYCRFLKFKCASRRTCDAWVTGGPLTDKEPVDENLHDWFGKEKWVRMDTKGNIKGPCAREPGEGKPKCLPQAKAHALGKKGRASAAQKKRREDPNPNRRGPAHNVATKVQEDDLDENCWKGYHKEGNKELFGKRVPNCVKNEAVAESHESCPECGGAMYPDTMINEKQDACYYKVKSRYKVWPSAYASGALVQCRKKGAKNWGNKSKNESVENSMDELSRILELSTGLSLEARAELTEKFNLIESVIEGLAKYNGVDSEVIWEDLESLSDDELYVFATTTTIMETEAWQKVNKKDRTAGMSQKAVNAYRREHPGSKLKTAVTTKPSKLKRGSKASKRRKSYCSRSRGQMKMHNISCAKTPDKAICKARRRWNCE